MKRQILFRHIQSILTSRITRHPCLPARLSPCQRYATSGEPKDRQDEHDTARLEVENEEGAMSRRLVEMTEQSIQDPGGRSKKVMHEAGFSEELISKLEDRIKAAEFKTENASAFAQVNMFVRNQDAKYISLACFISCVFSHDIYLYAEYVYWQSGAGQGTRNVAAAQPWTGAEEQQDAVLRMLNDKYKPLRGARSPVGLAAGVSLPRKAAPRSSGQRLANARDRSSIYSMVNDPGMSAEEKEQMRKELKERFTPGARPMPTSIQGIATLANERIEDAIARGQFKNLPRGKVIERDYNASSPFLDTTEYFMNKIIQKQEIVPPWIEKQQELVRSTAVFRSRLRADWKRHAARVIASKGGSLEEQVGRAERCAVAEQEQLGTPSQPPPNSAEEVPAPSQDSTTTNDSPQMEETPYPEIDSSPENQTQMPRPPPAPLTKFRDLTWERAERSYQTLSITNLNNLTRSYNLMAPDLAKKPYFSLDRELRACYIDVAPQLANEIRERASIPARRIDNAGDRPGSLLDRFSGGGAEAGRIYDSKRPNYGFKDFWRDLWGVSSSTGKA